MNKSIGYPGITAIGYPGITAIGYPGITSIGTLIDYTEDGFRIETWKLPDRIVQCIWLSQNEGALPTTMTYQKTL